MTKDETKAAIEVMQAWLDGKKIEGKARDEDETAWSELTRCERAYWSWSEYDFRIKPEAREFWLDPNADYPNVIVFEDYDPGDKNYIKVREVIE